MSSIGSTTGRKPGDPLRIAITTGEPAGIGPEISLAALSVLDDAGGDARITLIGDTGLLEQRALRRRVTWPAAANIEHVPLANGRDRGPSRFAQCALRSGDARSSNRRRDGTRLRRDRHGAGAEERHQRRASPIYRPHRISGRAHRYAARRDDAGWRHCARSAASGAGDDASADCLGRRRVERRRHRRGAEDSAHRVAIAIRHRYAARRRHRPESARR